jgi:OPA family glycerol-3-phosphate transporter-like MFS transporter
MSEPMPGWLSELLPIVALLALIFVLVSRLPRVDLGHSPAFLRRRFLNWFPVGLTYAFLYMARYNLRVCTNVVFDKAQFSEIYFWGTLTYGFAFVLNGPLTDRLGGKKTIMVSAVGSPLANVAMGLVIMRATVGAGVPKEAQAGLVPILSLLYALNMYFQSFGAVAIVKVNAAWFHLRERGTFSGIFGILISLGLYFAFDWCKFIVEHASVPWVFFIPASILATFALLDFVFVRDTPGESGHADFDLGDASSGDDGPRLPLKDVAVKVLKNPAIVTIAAIEFCSGYLRNAILQYYQTFAEETHRAASPTMKKVAAALTDPAERAAALASLPREFVHDHWGMLNCMAGITGGVFAGLISDRIFRSRRGPVAAVLYAIMLLGAIVMFPTLDSRAIGWVVLVMTFSIIGVHGMLSGTASMDFGGKKNVGVVVGIIDGCVYLGTALEALVLGHVLPEKAAQQDAKSWWTWPAVLIPAAVVGLALATRVWNARPKASAVH